MVTRRLHLSQIKSVYGCWNCCVTSSTPLNSIQMKMYLWPNYLNLHPYTAVWWFFHQKKLKKKHPPRTQKIPTSQFSDLTCQSFRGSWCLKDDRPFRPPAAPQRNTLPPVTTLPYLTPPHPSWARQTKIKSEWSESGPGSHFADQSVDTWLSLTGRPFNPIVSPTGLLSVVPLSLWLRAGERPD